MWRNKARLRTYSPNLPRSLWCAIGGLVAGGVLTGKIASNRSTRKNCHQSTQTESAEEAPSLIGTLPIPTSPTLEATHSPAPVLIAPTPPVVDSAELVTVSEGLPESSQEVITTTLQKPEGISPTPAIFRAQSSTDFTHQRPIGSAPAWPRTINSSTQTLLERPKPTRTSYTQTETLARNSYTQTDITPGSCSECLRPILSPSEEAAERAERMEYQSLLATDAEAVMYMKAADERVEERVEFWKREAKFRSDCFDRLYERNNLNCARSEEVEQLLKEERENSEKLDQQNVDLKDEVFELKAKLRQMEHERARALAPPEEFTGPQ